MDIVTLFQCTHSNFISLQGKRFKKSKTKIIFLSSYSSEKGFFFLEGSVIAPNTPPQLRYWLNALDKSANIPRVNSFFSKGWFICSTNWRISCSGECLFEIETVYSIINCFQWDIYLVYCTLYFEAFLRSMEVQTLVGSLSLMKFCETSKSV